MITHFRQAIEETLPWLSSFGADPTGGMTRLLYSPEWLETQQQFKKRMAASGLETRFDEVGNLYGRLSGTEYPQEVVLSGSHIDTVVNGGNLDGQFGALAAWLAIDWLKTQYGAPLRTVEVVAMAEEEGSRFPYVFWGSKNIFGLANPDDVRNICDAKGNSFVDAMKACGFTLPNAPLTPRQDIKAFVELHIEQGADLEERGLTCGAVTAIVGYDRLFLTLHGEANHAGTTSMRRRRDALAAAAEVILGVKELAEADDRFVATVGQLNVAPNAVNIVPGKVQLAIETRAADDRVLAEVRAKIMSLLERTASKSGVVITKENDFHVAAVPLSESVRKVIEQSAAECGVSFQAMPSWAGHDAQIFAASGVPTGMIFVPSINGVSHSKEESSDFQSVTQAVKVLEKTLKTLAEV